MVTMIEARMKKLVSEGNCYISDIERIEDEVSVSSQMTSRLPEGQRVRSVLVTIEVNHSALLWSTKGWEIKV